MKISIEGTHYELFEAIGQAALGDLAVLKKRGVTVRSIKAAFETVTRIMSDPDMDGLDLLEDDDYIANMIAVVFLAKRRAGDMITLEEAERVPATEIFLVMEVEDVSPKDEGEPPTTSTT